MIMKNHLPGETGAMEAADHFRRSRSAALFDSGLLLLASITFAAGCLRLFKPDLREGLDEKRSSSSQHQALCCWPGMVRRFPMVNSKLNFSAFTMKSAKPQKPRRQRRAWLSTLFPLRRCTFLQRAMYGTRSRGMRKTTLGRTVLEAPVSQSSGG
jgi:hypothetical protein